MVKKLRSGSVGQRERLIVTCVECGDLSPLLPLSEADCIFIQEFQEQQEKKRLAELEIWLDIRFFLARLSGCFTGTDGMNFLPSKVAEMGRKWEERQKNSPA